jgi:hypothetical protein
VVTAQIFPGNGYLEQYGMVSNHVYTVVAYDAANQRVRLYNPHHQNPWFTNNAGKLTFRGSDTEPSNNGYFWMGLSVFTQMFSAICYEE